MSEPTTGQPAASSEQPVATPADTNANDQASQSTSPVSSAAPTVSNETPENKVSEGKLSEEATTYLKSQNIDLSKIGVANDQQSADNFIAWHKSLRKQNASQNANQTKSAASIADVVDKPTQQPTQQADQQTAQVATPQQAAPKMPSQMDIINIKGYLERTYKDTDPNLLGTDTFYKGMREMGFSPLTAGGELNVTAITQYGQIVADKAELAKLKSEKRPTSVIPDTNNQVESYADVQKADVMDDNAAAAIIAFNNQQRRAGSKALHPQTQEAEEYLKHAGLRRK